MRVARLQSWTLPTAREQPFEDLLYIVADAVLEAEAINKPTSGGSTPAAPAPKSVERFTINNL